MLEWSISRIVAGGTERGNNPLQLRGKLDFLEHCIAESYDFYAVLLQN